MKITIKRDTLLSLIKNYLKDQGYVKITNRILSEILEYSKEEINDMELNIGRNDYTTKRGD